MHGSTVLAGTTASQSTTPGASSPELQSVTGGAALKKGGLPPKGAMHSTHLLDCPRDGLVFVELDGEKPRCPECGKFLSEDEPPFGTGWGDDQTDGVT